jgi:hypothetical protein
MDPERKQYFEVMETCLDAGIELIETKWLSAFFDQGSSGPARRAHQQTWNAPAP